MKAGLAAGTTTTRRAASVALLGLVAFGALGCAGRQQLITSLRSLEEQQAAAAREGTADGPSIQLIFSEGRPLSQPFELPPMGSVVLVMSDIAPSPLFQRPPVVGAAEGALHGALAGAAMPLMISAYVAQGAGGSRVGLMVVGAGLAAAPVGAAIGAGIGALAAASREEVEQGTAALERAFADMRVSDTLASQIQEAARRHPVLVLSVERPGSPTTVADNVLEIDTPRVWLTSYDVTDWVPKLRLRVGVWVRLVRTSDGEELDRWWCEHAGSTARLADWSKHDAGLFRAGLEHALDAVALQAVNRLLPQPLSSAR